jgi:hypothetical protein
VSRLRIGFPVVLFLCVLGSDGFAQDAQAPAPVDQPAGGSPKVPAKTGENKTGANKTSENKASASKTGVREIDAHKNKNSPPRTAQPASEEAERAARLAEARKKFFEQSTGFDNKETDKTLSLGGSNGLSPGLGFKF